MYLLGFIVTFLVLFCYWVYAYNNRAKHWFFKELCLDLNDTEGKTMASIISLVGAVFWPFTWCLIILGGAIIGTIYVPVLAFSKLIK